MSMEEGTSKKITMARASLWAIKNGVGAALAIAVAQGFMEIGAIRSSVISQGERQAAYEESHKADMGRIDAKIDTKNSAQNEKLSEHGQALATIPVILKRNEAALTLLREQTERSLTLFREQTERALTRLEEKVDRMDIFLRGDKDSVSMDGKGSTKNVSAGDPCEVVTTAGRYRRQH